MSEQPPHQQDPLLRHTNLSIVLVVAFAVAVVVLVARLLYSPSL